ncbi:MAG: hypothetical protein M0C28_02950 [Candidatus Moduliflexus flocculans]|nr:hypothetical protein [Candidatus Moduliflexus flocculans]
MDIITAIESPLGLPAVVQGPRNLAALDGLPSGAVRAGDEGRGGPETVDGLYGLGEAAEGAGPGIVRDLRAPFGEIVHHGDHRFVLGCVQGLASVPGPGRGRVDLHHRDRQGASGDHQELHRGDIPPRVRP